MLDWKGTRAEQGNTTQVEVTNLRYAKSRARVGLCVTVEHWALPWM